MTNIPKKPANQKGKSIYFNIDDPGELRLYKYTMNLKNFSGYMKAMLYTDMMRNGGQTPDPYNYAAVMKTDLSLQETPLTVQSPSETAAEETPPITWGIPTEPTVKSDKEIQESHEEEEIENQNKEELIDEVEHQEDEPQEETQSKPRGRAGFML